MNNPNQLKKQKNRKNQYPSRNPWYPHNFTSSILIRASPTLPPYTGGSLLYKSITKYVNFNQIINKNICFSDGPYSGKFYAITSTRGATCCHASMAFTRGLLFLWVLLSIRLACGIFNLPHEVLYNIPFD